MQRKIIQISESMAGGGEGGAWNLTALCNDGTLWILDNIHEGWKALPNIPLEGMDIEYIPLTPGVDVITEGDEVFRDGNWIKLSCGFAAIYSTSVWGADTIRRPMPKEGRILTCVYCGHAYPQGTPAAGSKVLTDHIRICEKHPLREAEEKIEMLRSALIDLVGTSDPKELDAMEAHTRIFMPVVPLKDSTSMINAINAIRKTEEKPSPTKDNE